MKSILEKLWAGKINPSKNVWMKNEEEQKLYFLIQKNKSILEQLLDEKGKDRLDAFDSCHTELELILQEQAFIEGFSLATKLFSESI